jgi:hypothetical protein
MKIAYNQNNELICPHCGCEHSYLHHDQVAVYSRKEDAPTVTKTVIRGREIETSVVDNDTSGNPSWRRDGVTIRFWCELCLRISELTLAQHKGMTQIEWRQIGRIVGDHVYLLQCA